MSSSVPAGLEVESLQTPTADVIPPELDAAAATDAEVATDSRASISESESVEPTWRGAVFAKSLPEVTLWHVMRAQIEIVVVVVGWWVLLLVCAAAVGGAAVVDVPWCTFVCVCVLFWQ